MTAAEVSRDTRRTAWRVFSAMSYLRCRGERECDPYAHYNDRCGNRETGTYAEVV